MKNEEIGELAMEYISDYPLYASTCGITYNEAIKIAEALNESWQQELEINKLSEHKK